MTYTDTERAQYLAELNNQFMRPHIYGPIDVVVWSDDEGFHILPADDAADCDIDPDAEDYAVLPGHYIGRLSAPGYMDCTDWHYGASYNAVADKLIDYYYAD